MRAAQLSVPSPAGEDPLDLVDRPVPALHPHEVLVRVEACGVCRTDLQICEGDLEAQVLPVVPGHQVVGTVVERDDAATGVEVGDRVGIAWIASTCGRCRFCRRGRENLCDHSRFTGWHRDGGYAEFVTAHADYVYALPAGLEAMAAAPLLCGGAIGLRSLRVAGVRPGARLGLFGFGASATVAIQIARHWDCAVYVCTRSEAEQERARRLGAEWAGGYDEAPPERLDAAVTFAPVGSVVVDALRALDKGGVVAINAIHLDHIPQFDYADLWWERQIRSVANVTRTDVTELLALAAQIPIVTEVQRYRLADANRALADLAAGRVSGAAVLEMD